MQTQRCVFPLVLCWCQYPLEQFGERNLPPAGVRGVRAVAWELPSAGRGGANSSSLGMLRRLSLSQRYLFWTVMLFFCFDRRSKYSKAKQEADEEKHLNQGKKQWCLDFLIRFVKHVACSDAWEIREDIPLRWICFCFPLLQTSSLKAMHFSNRENRSIWVKNFEDTDRRKVHHLFCYFFHCSVLLIDICS